MPNDLTLENAKPSEKSIDFLVTEYQGAISQWQHMDDRMDKEIQYYLTLFGITGTGVGVLLQLGTNPIVTLGMVHLLSMVIGIAGFRLLRRITHLTRLGALLAAQIGLVRRAIIDMDPSIEGYLLLTVATKDQSAHDFKPISTQLAVRILVFVNSLLVAIVFFLIPYYFYFYIQNIFPAEVWAAIFTFAGIASAIIGALFFRYQRRVIVKRGDENLNNITKAVQKSQQSKAKNRVAG